MISRPGVFGIIMLPASIAATLFCIAIALWCPWWPLLFVYVPGTGLAWYLTYYTWGWARD